MALGVLGQQFSGGIEMGVFADAGENIQDLAPVRLRILHPIGREERQPSAPRKIDQLPIYPLFAAKEMPLNFDENIFAAKGIDQKFGTVRRTLGSARVSRAGFGVAPERSLQFQLAVDLLGLESSRWRRRHASTRDACAPRSKERDQPFRKLRQLIPLHRAFPFLAAQMRLSEQFAQIFVTGAIFDQHRQNTAVFHRQFAANDRPNILLARRDRKSLRAVNPVAIEQRHRRHLQFGGDFS